MKKLFSQSWPSRKHLQTYRFGLALAGLFFALMVVVFLFRLTLRAELQYASLGGNLNVLTLSQKLGLTGRYIKTTYLMSAEERYAAQARAQTRETSRLQLPMNQQFRLSLFLKGDYAVSLALPQRWRQQVRVEERSNNEATFSYATSSQLLPIFSVYLKSELATSTLKSTEKLVKNKFGQKVIIMVSDGRAKDPKINQLLLQFKNEVLKISQSAEIIKN